MQEFSYGSVALAWLNVLHKYKYTHTHTSDVSVKGCDIITSQFFEKGTTHVQKVNKNGTTHVQKVNKIWDCHRKENRGNILHTTNEHNLVLHERLSRAHTQT